VKLRTLVAAVLGTAGAVWLWMQACRPVRQLNWMEKRAGAPASGGRAALDARRRRSPGVLPHFADTRRDAEAVALYQRLATCRGSLCTSPGRTARLIQLELAAGNRAAATAHLAT